MVNALSYIADIANRTVSALARPVKLYPWAWLIIGIALFVPELYGRSFAEASRLVWQGLTGNMLPCMLISYIFVSLSCLASRAHKTLGLILSVFFTFTALAAACMDHFLFSRFGTHVNAYILQLLDETSSSESAEFLTTYILQPAVLWYLLAGVAAIIAGYAVKKAFQRLQEHHMASQLCRYLLALYLIACSILTCKRLGGFTSNVIDNDVFASIHGDTARSFTYLTYNSVLQFVQDKQDFDRCAEHLDGIEAAISDDAASPMDIVVIVGESHNKYHSSLYGYPMPTDPYLASMDGLSIYDDVITSVNATSQSFKSFLSFASMDNGLKWCDTPLFPAVFKSAGYNVICYSNQFVHDPQMSLYNASCGFFNHPSMRDKLFSYKNTRKYRYDHELIDEYKAKRDSIEVQGHNLVIFHLNGQHVSASERYPHDMARFDASDYDYRTDLNEAQKEYVAHYDNATRYVDSLLCDIMDMYSSRDAVVLYFSDHGDEVYDFRDHIGRSYNFDDGGAEAVHHQMDIPFVIYVSPSCRDKHPEFSKAIANAVHTPFMTDDLPHLLLDMAGISCQWFDASRSPINPSYVVRKRVPRAITPTVRLDYDSIK